MTLELTPEEYNRFSDHLMAARNIGINNRTRISPEREALILQAIRDRKSSKAIKRELKTSDPTIAKIKKQNKLWGV